MLYIFDLDGTLIKSFLVDVPCTRCEGRGKVTDTQAYTPNPPPEVLMRDCKCCRGRGHLLRHTEEGYDHIELLPNVKDILDGLAVPGNLFAIATNQTGVSYGYQTREQVGANLTRVMGLIPWIDDTRACFDPEDEWNRKPGPGMLLDLMEECGVQNYETIFVGDMPSDRDAAAAAGVAYCDADLFFRRARPPAGSPGGAR